MIDNHQCTLSQLLLLIYFVESAAPADFQNVNTQLTFTSGQTTGDNQCTNIQVFDDSILEEAETFTLQLFADDTSVVTINGSANSSVVTIIEDPIDGKDKLVLAME